MKPEVIVGQEFKSKAFYFTLDLFCELVALCVCEAFINVLKCHSYSAVRIKNKTHNFELQGFH